ncbi:MAG: histidine phosphatase family protein [Dehalococcoidia bacterium]|nr:histidine phosphatase family protein [Dehalococcoidia bacterium]
MDLILWRHAEAKDGDGPVADTDRELTARGIKHAQEIAEWLREQKLSRVTVLSSPARRSIQTAEMLGLPVKIKTQLGVGASTADLLGAADWPDQSGAIILVSHQPALGRVAALLLAGSEADWTIKKAGVWWFTNRVRNDETQTVLRAVRNP